MWIEKIPFSIQFHGIGRCVDVSMFFSFNETTIGYVQRIDSSTKYVEEITFYQHIVKSCIAALAVWNEWRR
jgi:hypothetical protein